VPEISWQRKNVVLFLGRISEEKGLRLLFDVWRDLKPKDWTLVIAGPDWFGERGKLEEKIKNEFIENIRFAGVADVMLKDKLYRETKIFVLPSPMENFSAVVLDALAYAIPAIATKGTPWRVLSEKKCGWWIDQGVAPLREALRTALNMSDLERDCMGLRGREVIKEQYAWDSVVGKTLRIYEKVLDNC
jgi:glycosyltransferase involved in cell wall biosynthesis